MRISIYIATSANGFISNSRNVPDWLSPEYGKGLVEVCQQKRAVIMGRTTYEILAPAHLPLKDEGISIVLTSRSDIEPANATVMFTSDRPDKIASMLQEKGFTEAVIIGGTAVISEFFNAGLVNDIFMVVEPTLFGGGGLPLLKDVKRDHKMRLIDSTRLNDNTLKLHYQIVEPRRP